VRGHQGFVTVDSALGAGSTFRIHLPLEAEGPAESEVDSVEPSSGRAAASEA
jgi:hypothetical protein